MQGRSRMNRNRSYRKKPLFDVAESFTRQLERSRINRGEPSRGLGRRAWELRHGLTHRRPQNIGLFLGIAGTSLLVLTLIGGLIARPSEAERRKQQSDNAA